MAAKSAGALGSRGVVEDLSVLPDNAEGLRSVERLRAVVRREPGSYLSRFKLAQALAGVGAFGEGGNVLRECIDLTGDPQILCGVFFNLGVCREHEGEVEGAIAAYEQSLFLCPTLYWARLRLGQLLTKQGLSERAVKELTLAAAFDEDEGDAQVALAEAWLAQGRLREAQAAYCRALRRRPRNLAAMQALLRLEVCVH